MGGKEGYNMTKTLTFTSLHSQNDSGDLRGVAGGDGELGCLCGKAGTRHLCDGSAHSSGCVVNGYGSVLSYIVIVGKIHNLLSTACSCWILLGKVLQTDTSQSHTRPH